MKLPADFVIRKFLRTCMTPFSQKDFSAMLARIGMRFTPDECTMLLEENPNVFALVDGMYLTRAGAFTGQYFSMKPTRAEISKKVFIAGHRCIPFVDSEILSCDLTFLYNGTVLPRVVVDYSGDAALELFSLYGDEFSSQYIASDPANSDINLAETSFSLPPVVKMTSFSLEPVIKREGFSSGDRLVCRVSNWDKGIIEVSVLHHNSEPFQMDMADVVREDWYSLLENRLLSSFDIVGPCASIEQQLALVFAENRSELCVKNCGSIEELFLRSKKIGFELFGVETRLWRKNEDVPAIGRWNAPEVVSAPGTVLYENGIAIEPMLPYVIDSYVKDLLYCESEDYEGVLKSIYPFYYMISREQRKLLLLHLKNRHDILLRNYNRFADFEIGAIRHKALELYTTVNDLVCSINLVDSSLKEFPQRPLVILTQIFGHIKHIIEVLENSPSVVMEEIEEISLSIEGMECNFEGISSQLRWTVDKKRRSGFSVVK